MDIAFRSLLPFLRFVTVLLAVLVLFVGKDVLIPLALAALFTFLLSPLVRYLKKWRVPQVAAVVIVTIFTFAVIGLIGWFVFNNLNTLANDLPKYRENIHAKINSFKEASKGGTIEKIDQLFGEVSQGVTSPTPAPSGELNANPEDTTTLSKSKITNEGTGEVSNARTVTVIKDPENEKQSFVQKAINNTLPLLASGVGVAGVTIVFVIFFLLREAEIGERIVRLVGFSHLTDTTRAMDEVQDRISRYLLMQMTVNSTYGILLALGLWAIGLPYIFLWGVLGCLFRFIPYVGPIVIAALPIGLSLAVFDGWTQPLMVIALILVLELLTNMILEPMLYGQSVGVSDVALLIAITFWTWVWGPVGLILATPLTVCIVVLCKYVPTLGWVDTLMGDKVEAQPHLIFYKQMLADHHDDAQSYAENLTKSHGLEHTMDTVILPALALTRREQVYGKLEPEEATRIFESVDGLQEMLIKQDEKKEEEKHAEEIQVSESGEVKMAPVEVMEPERPKTRIVAKALNGSPDRQALEMLDSVLSDQYEMLISETAKLAGELLAELEESNPGLLIISAMPPRAQLAASVLCKRVRRSRPETKILIARWGLPEINTSGKILSDSGADWVVTSIEEARKIIETEVI